MKKLYYKISKVAHPDKCKDIIKTKLFLDAKKFYETDNLIGLLEICSKLKIDINLEKMNNTDFGIIYTNIKELEQNIKKIKESVSWKWSNTNDEKEKRKIKDWINNKIMKHFVTEYKFYPDNTLKELQLLNDAEQCVTDKIIEIIQTFLNPICTICSKSYKRKNKIYIIKKCNHEFHLNCLNNWIDKNNKYKCPICITFNQKISNNSQD